jgi:hypothetical protein
VGQNRVGRRLIGQGLLLNRYCSGSSAAGRPSERSDERNRVRLFERASKARPGPAEVTPRRH